MAASLVTDNYNAEEAKSEIQDLLTQVEGHDAWIQEQFNSTQTRLNAFQQAIKQAGRLKQMLDHQVGDVPTQQQYALIVTLKNDFLKAVGRIQDDLVSSTTGQSLDDSKIKIEELAHENDQIKHQLQQQNTQIASKQEQINTLRQENERLQRLKDLLMQQQDAMNQRLSQQKGKDRKIHDLGLEMEELKQSIIIVNQEKETLNNNFKLQIESLNSSCKQLIEQNNALRQQQQTQATDTAPLDELQKEYNDLETKYNEQIAINESLKTDLETKYHEQIAINESLKADMETKYNEQESLNADLETKCNEQIAINESLKADMEQINERLQSNEGLQSKIATLEEEKQQLQDTSEALANQLAEAEDETNEQIISLQTAQTNLQTQFTMLLQQKTDLKQENEGWVEKYNALNERYEKLTELNTEATERNLTAAAQVEELNETISKLQEQIQSTESANQNDMGQIAVLQSKIEELSQQIQNKNKQISEHRSKGEEMLNQREALQKKLSASQVNILELQRKCQDLESELAQNKRDNDNNNNNTVEYPTPTAPAPPGKEEDGLGTEGTVSRDDVLSFCNINNQLKPVDELITQFVAEWQYNSQVFILDDEEDIKENEGSKDRFKEWTSLETVLENVTSELNSKKKNIAQPQLCALVLDLIAQKILLLKHLGTVHMTKGQQMSQIMHEAQKRIVSLQSDLVKKNREMEIHLKVKQKMYEEIKSVQQKVENLTREYQTIVSELDHVRQRRKDSVDSSFS